MNSNSQRRAVGRAGGFTLVELLIVVAIIALLAAIGYPSYTEYVTRSHRQAGKNWMYAVADRQEQFFQDNKRYAVNLTDLGFAANVIVLDDNGQLTAGGDPDSKYTIDMINTGPRTYTVRATPVLVQAARDVNCQILTLTHQGLRDQTGAGDNCW